MSELLKYGSLLNQFWLSFWNTLYLIILLYKLCSDKAKPSKPISVAICIFIGQSTGWLCFAINAILFGHSPNSLIYYILRYIGTFGAGASSLLMYLFMDIQLSIVFKNSIYQVQKPVIFLHFIIFCILVILVIVINIMAVFSTLHSLVAILTLLFFALAAGGAIHMAYLFNKKLYLMMFNEKKHAVLREKRSRSISDTNSSHDTVDAQRRLDVLRIMVKVTNLISTFFVATVMIIGVLVLLIIWRNTVTIFIWLIGFSVYSIIPPLGIFLMLKINEDIYGCLCKCCHRRFNRLCNDLVEKNHAKGLELEMGISTTIADENGEENVQKIGDNVQIATIEISKADDDRGN